MKTHISLPKSDFEDTLLYTINKGKKLGYKKEFIFEDKVLKVDHQSFSPENLEIMGVKRFEGMTDPGDSMIYYRIKTLDGKKGYFVSAYGPKANHEALDFLSRVKESESQESL